jgi:hypothetical protein
MIKKSIPLSNIVNWDEIRIYATKQDLGSVTLESANIKDPRVKKIQNPKEAYTGIFKASADGKTLEIYLLTTKKLPQNKIVHEVAVPNYQWNAKSKSVDISQVFILNNL